MRNYLCRSGVYQRVARGRLPPPTVLDVVVTGAVDMCQRRD